MAARAAPRPLRSRVHHSPFRTTVPLCCARIFTRVRWQRCGPPPKRSGRGGGRSHRATPPPIQARRTLWCPADAGVAQTKPGWVHDPTVTECTDYLPPTTRGLAHTPKWCSMRAVALFPVVLHGRGTLPPCRSAARPPPRRGGSVARAGVPSAPPLPAVSSAVGRWGDVSGTWVADSPSPMGGALQIPQHLPAPLRLSLSPRKDIPRGGDVVSAASLIGHWNQATPLVGFLSKRTRTGQATPRFPQTASAGPCGHPLALSLPPTTSTATTTVSTQ